MHKNVPKNEIFSIFSGVICLLISKSLLQSVLLSKDEHGGINNYIHFLKKVDNVTFVAPPFKCIHWKCYFNDIASIGSNITRKYQNKIKTSRRGPP